MSLGYPRLSRRSTSQSKDVETQELGLKHTSRRSLYQAKFECQVGRSLLRCPKWERNLKCGGLDVWCLCRPQVLERRVWWSDKSSPVVINSSTKLGGGQEMALRE